MEVQLQRSYLEYTNALFSEGFLDGQFVQLQMLRDESNPDFVVEVVTLFFEDSQRIVNELSMALLELCVCVCVCMCYLYLLVDVCRDEHNVNFKKIDANVHQLKGSSSSIGAQRVRNACIAFRSFCNEQNVEGCLKCLQQGKQEYLVVKTKLEALLRLEQQIVAAGGVVPTLNDVS